MRDSGVALHRRREPRVGVDDGQNPDLAAGGELVVDEIHGPGLVAPRRRTTVVPQICLHPALGSFVAQLQAQALVQATDPLRIDRPAIPPQQEVHPAIAIRYILGRSLFTATHGRNYNL